MLAWYWQSMLWRITMACSKQKGSWQASSWIASVNKEKCRQCPHPQHSLMHLRTWPSTRWLMFKPSEPWDTSSRSWEKAAPPLAYLCRKSKQAVSEALPTHRHVNRNRQGVRTAGEDIRWGGRKPFVGVKHICCRPTHLFRMKSTLSPVTDPNVFGLL